MHRNSQKRIYRKDAVYFITTNTDSRFPYFKQSILCDLFIEELKLCKKMKNFELYAFCVLYDHIHLLLRPNDEFDISRIMFSLKKQFSHEANRMMGICSMRPSSSDQTVGRFQERKETEGAKPFLRLGSVKSERVKTPLHLKQTIPKFKWQKSYHDHIIRGVRDFENHYKYTKFNFLKHHKDGYGQNWEYSSGSHLVIIDDPIF